MKFIHLLMSFFTGILFSIVLIGGCKGKQNKLSDKDNAAAETGVTSANSGRLSDEKFMQEAEKYKEFSSEYDKRRKGLLKIFRKNMTQYVWYDYKEFKDKLKLLEDEGADGIRIYIGMYPDSAKRSGRTADPNIVDVSNHINLFFVGTERKISSSGKYNHWDLVDRKKGLFAVFGANNKDVFNEGTLCPPPDKDCKEEGAYFLED